MSHACKADKLLIKPTAGARPASPCTSGRIIRKARTRGLTPEESQTTRTTPGWQWPLTDRPAQSHRRLATIYVLSTLAVASAAGPAAAEAHARWARCGTAVERERADLQPFAENDSPGGRHTRAWHLELGVVDPRRSGRGGNLSNIPRPGAAGRLVISPMLTSSAPRTDARRQ
jgi:hypothetical protein